MFRKHKEKKERRFREEREPPPPPPPRPQPRRGRRPKPARTCANCQVKQSTQWREGPPHMTPLCNACGIRYRRCVQRGIIFPSDKPRPRNKQPMPLIPPSSIFGGHGGNSSVDDLELGKRRKRSRDQGGLPHPKRKPPPGPPRSWVDENGRIVLPDPFSPYNAPEVPGSFAIPKGQSSTFGNNQPFGSGSHTFGGFESINPKSPYPQPVHPPLPTMPRQPPPNQQGFPNMYNMPMPGFNPAMPNIPGINEPRMTTPPYRNTIPRPRLEAPHPQRNPQRPQRPQRNPRSSQKLPSLKGKFFRKK